MTVAIASSPAGANSAILYPAARKREGAMEQEGGCACGKTRYTMTAAPLIVHACHCRDCQRLTGSAFALNIWIERCRVETDHARLTSSTVAAGSGKPHEIFRCPDCGIQQIPRRAGRHRAAARRDA
jgi:hypothetical protein